MGTIREEIDAIYEEYADADGTLPSMWQDHVDELLEKLKPPPRIADVIMVGWDPAKERDFSAIACLGLQAEWQEKERSWTITRADCLKLERLPQGMAYPAQVKRVVEMRRNVTEKADKTPNVFVDATGLGAAMLDFAKEQGLADAYAVVITGGLEPQLNWKQRKLKIPKAELISGLSALIFGGLLKLPAKYESVVKEELAMFRGDRRPSDGRAKLEAMPGYHDDLVVALALAMLIPPPPYRSGSTWYA